MGCETGSEGLVLPFATSSPVCGENKSKVALSLAGTSLLLISNCVSKIWPPISKTDHELFAVISYLFPCSLQVFTGQLSREPRDIMHGHNPHNSGPRCGGVLPSSMVGSRVVVSVSSKHDSVMLCAYMLPHIGLDRMESPLVRRTSACRRRMQHATWLHAACCGSLQVPLTRFLDKTA